MYNFFIRIKMNFATYTYNNDYFLFNNNSKNILDHNTICDDNVVVFPNNLYRGSPVSEPHFKKDPIDRNTIYWSAGLHPSHTSKFGYKGCPFGYCYGPQSGRNYNLPPSCHQKYTEKRSSI